MQISEYKYISCESPRIKYLNFYSSRFNDDNI